MGGSTLLVVAIAILVASFVQVIAGFGFALLCMPIMTLAVDVKEAVVVSTLVGAVAISWQAWVLRHDVATRVAGRLCLGAVFGMPLGLVVLRHAPEHAPLVQQIVGNILGKKNISPATVGEEEFQKQRHHYAHGLGGLMMVGDPDQIAKQLAELSQAGLRGIGFSFVNYLRELPYFCDEVLPRLERMGIREKR